MSVTGSFPRLLVPLAVAALLLGLSGCGKDDPKTAPSADPTTATPSDTPTPSETATPSESPSATPTETTTAAPDPGTLLLPASGMAGFSASWGWSVKGTGAEHGPFGKCQRFPMTTIGADRTVVRSYVPAGDLTGGTGAHLVSSFVDDKSAGQAISVLRSWHDRCKERLNGYGFKKVGPVTSVSTSKGDATWYLVTYAEKDSDEGRFDALGVLRSGSTVELLQLNLNGSDYNYPPGREPMVKALQNAAARLP
jgi:hypothetical protein